MQRPKWRSRQFEFFNVLCHATVVLRYCFATYAGSSVLRYCCATLLLCYATAVIRYCCATLLLCHATVVLRYCCATLLLCQATLLLCWMCYYYATLDVLRYCCAKRHMTTHRMENQVALRHIYLVHLVDLVYLVHVSIYIINNNTSTWGWGWRWRWTGRWYGWWWLGIRLVWAKCGIVEQVPV